LSANSLDSHPIGLFYVVVSGPPGSGKTTVARELARALGFPLLSKDTIKEAMMASLEVTDVDQSDPGREAGGAQCAEVLRGRRRGW